MRHKHLLYVSFALTCVAAYASPVDACTRVMPISLERMLRSADVIVRATADEYVVPAVGQRFRQGFELGTIRFIVRETLKGSVVSSIVVLPGVLTERDDFNDHEPPYRFIRPEGRHGDCVATAYRRGADFLLFLQSSDGEYRVYPEALGPVNEQLHGPDDAWLKWVQTTLANLPASPPNIGVKPAALNMSVLVAAPLRRGLRAVR